MQTDFRIRDYKPEDYPRLLDLWKETGLGAAHRGDVPEVIHRTIACGGKLLIMTDISDHEIIGSSWLTVDGRRTYLHHFGISVAKQGQGLSKPLLKATLAKAKEIGYQLKLEVHKDNLKAVGLYKDFGFSYLGDYDVYIIRDILGSLE